MYCRAFAYISAVTDKHGRVIIYFSAANSPPDMRPEDYLKMLFFVINKYDNRIYYAQLEICMKHVVCMYVCMHLCMRTFILIVALSSNVYVCMYIHT